MVTSGELSKKGKATFDGLVVMREFAQANPEFMAKFVRTVADANAAYLAERASLTDASPVVQANAKLLGGEPADVRAALALYDYPDLEAHASARWLGGGAEGGAVKALAATAEFLEAQGKVDRKLDDYSGFVTPAYAEAAMKLQR